MVTGAATWTGGRLVQRLEGLPDVEVIAVDELPPTIEFNSPVHELAIDELEFAHFFLDITGDGDIHHKYGFVLALFQRLLNGTLTENGQWACGG